MDVIIDQERNFQFLSEPPDVLAALVAANEFLRQKGRVIVAIKADGLSVSPNTMVAAFKDKPLADVAELDIVSQTVATLVQQSLDELEGVLPDLPQACHRLAEVFQSQSPETGYEPFDKLATIWQTVKEREIQIVRALQLDLETLNIGGASIAQVHTELNGFLDEAAEALKIGDCILLGDLLEYELAPKAELEFDIVRLLRGQAEKKFAAEAMSGEKGKGSEG